MADDAVQPKVVEHSGIVAMTEDEKRRVVVDLLVRAETAERRGLPHTGKGWRDLVDAAKAKPASKMILARPIGEFDISELIKPGSSQ